MVVNPREKASITAKRKAIINHTNAIGMVTPNKVIKTSFPSKLPVSNILSLSLILCKTRRYRLWFFSNNAAKYLLLT